MKDIEIVNLIVDKVLAYKPKRKAKKRKRARHRNRKTN
jgi:hypothetical protein